MYDTTKIINTLRSLIKQNNKEKIKIYLNSIHPDIYNRLNETYSNDTDTKYLKRPNFLCPKLSVEVIKCCNNKSCGYYVDYPYVSNCILGFLETTNKREDLTFHEIAILLHEKPKRIINIYEKALNRIQKNPRYIKETLGADYIKEEKKYEYIQTKKVCCVCESRIDKVQPDLYISKIGLAYCSQECKDEKSPHEIKIEFLTGISAQNYEDMINNTYNKTTAKKILLHIKQIKCTNKKTNNNEQHEIDNDILEYDTEDDEDIMNQEDTISLDDL